MADRRQGERWDDDFLYEVPDAHAFRVDAGGGGRSHDVEGGHDRNMMTQAGVWNSGASGARGWGGSLRRQEHPFELVRRRRLVLFRAKAIHRDRHEERTLKRRT